MGDGQRLFASFFLHAFGQVLEPNYSVFGKHDGVLHDIFQLADVSGIGILGKGVLRRRLQFFNLFAGSFLVLQDKVTHQRRYHHAPFPEGRQVQVEGVQPVVQVFAEVPLFHGLLKVAVGGRHDTHVQVAGLGLADATDFAAL